MNIVVRVDSSKEIGSGHIMRSLTLADQLSAKGTNVSFVCRDLPGNISTFAEKKGYKVYRLPFVENRQTENFQDLLAGDLLESNWKTDAYQAEAVLRANQQIDCMIVDHYDLDSRWETQMRPFTKKIMVIDDLANRDHNCDLLLDQNLCENLESRYEGLIPKHCRKFLGPQYVLLRPEFIEAQKNLRKRTGDVRRILIFFGGADPTNETTKALKSLRLINRLDIAVDVIVGASNSNKDQIKLLCSSMRNTTFYCNVNNIAKMMAMADLAIGAGGTATWERCLLALPAITVVIAQNQMENTAAVAKAGAAWNLGWHNKVSIESLSEAIKKALDDPERLKEIGEKAAVLMERHTLMGSPELIDAIIGEVSAKS